MNFSVFHVDSLMLKCMILNCSLFSNDLQGKFTPEKIRVSNLSNSSLNLVVEGYIFVSDSLGLNSS